MLDIRAQNIRVPIRRLNIKEILQKCEGRLGSVHGLKATNEMTVLKIGPPRCKNFYFPKFTQPIFPNRACCRSSLGPNRKRAFSRNHITTIDSEKRKTTIMLCAKNSNDERSAIIPGIVPDTYSKLILAEQFVRTHCSGDIILDTTFPNIVFNGTINNLDFDALKQVLCVSRMKNYQHALKVGCPERQFNTTVYKTGKAVVTGASTIEDILLSCRFLDYVIEQSRKVEYS